MFLAAAFLNKLSEFFWGDSFYWTIFGVAGNVMFTSRFVVQWYASEKLKQSIIPKNFWHLSLLGGVINLIYAVHVWKLPFILGSILPPVIAARNLMLISNRNDLEPPHTEGQATEPGTIDDGELELEPAGAAAEKDEPV